MAFLCASMQVKDDQAFTSIFMPRHIFQPYHVATVIWGRRVCRQTGTCAPAGREHNTRLCRTERLQVPNLFVPMMRNGLKALQDRTPTAVAHH